MVVPMLFPRHRCRGLIEGFHIDFPWAVENYFRGIDAAASLKGCPRLGGAVCGLHFRGIDAAASLKDAAIRFRVRRVSTISAASMPRPH